MFRLIRFLLTLALLAALVYGATTIPLGSRTLWQHIQAIASTRESQTLVKEVKAKAQELLHRDAGPARVEDNLTDEEKRKLRRLIRQKLEGTTPPEAP